MVAPQRTLKGIYTWAQTFYYRRFHLPYYKSWVRKCHQALPDMLFLLDQLLVKDGAVRFIDSTMLQVCKLVRADRNRVAKGIAALGKNWQGWHYGFKLHASCNTKGQLAAVFFTLVNEHDAQQIPHLVNDATRWWPSVTVATQLTLLRARPRIECVFGYLKEHLLLVTSFPRSVNGYAVHYIRTLLAY